MSPHRRTRRLAAVIPLLALVALVACAGTRDAPPAPEPGVGGDSLAHCLALDREACRADERCEAIPYWGESLVPCDEDERGFADNCPFEGCRPRGADCPSLARLLERCPRACPLNDFGIDRATGCRVCDCRGRGVPPD